MAEPALEGADEGREPLEGPITLTTKKSSREVPMRPGEADTVEWVYALHADAEKGKQDQCNPEMWDDDIATFWGDQWPANLPTYKPRIVVNVIKSLMLTELSDLTDSRISIFCLDKEAGSRNDQVENVMQTYWADQFCDLTVMFAALDAMVFPLGFLQSGIDPLASQGQGEVLFSHRDPRSVFPDPDARDDRELRYMILKDVLDLVQIHRDYPETGPNVNPEMEYSIKLSDSKSRLGPKAGAGYVGPLYQNTGMAGVPGYAKARAGVLTCTVDDPELKEELQEIQGKVRSVRLARYPDKRLIIVANKRILYDENHPLKYEPMITRVMLQPPIHSYWPQQSMVNEFGEIQSTANKQDSMVAENMLRLNSGLMFGDADCGINPSTWAPIPGLFTLVKPGSKVWAQNGVPMDQSMVMAGERTRGFIYSTLGYPLSRTGAGTHGNVAAELAETEISQSMGLTRLRGRLMYQAVQRAVQMLFARMAQCYTTPRHFPYVEDGDLKSIKWKPVDKPENYILRVDPATFEVRSQTMMQRLALALAKLGKLPDDELLKMLKWPNYQQTAAKLKQQLQLQAAANMKRKKGK